jgi:hypothetical protein
MEQKWKRDNNQVLDAFYHSDSKLLPINLFCHSGHSEAESRIPAKNTPRLDYCLRSNDGRVISSY